MYQSISLAGKRISLRIFHSTPYWQTAETDQLVTAETHTHMGIYTHLLAQKTFLSTQIIRKMNGGDFHQFAL